MPLLGPDGEPATKPAPGIQDQTPDEPQAPVRVTTAFVVYQTPGGQWFASDDLEAVIVPTRKPGPDDLIAGTENIKAQTIGSMTARMTAKLTVQTQMAMAQQMQQQQLSPDEAAAVAASKVPAAYRRR